MSQPVQAGRLASLDAFRGLTIAGMILVNNPGSWRHVYPPLRHAEWHGWTPTDLIFPFFLFIVGVSMAFSLPHRLARDGKPGLYRQVCRRSLVLFALGLLLSAFPSFDLANLRVAGVLQRIAVVYLSASVIVLELSRKAQVRAAAILLLGYWAMMTLIPVPGHGAGVLTPEANLASWVDRRLLPGRLWQETWDPEGLLSTLPAIATALLGFFTGSWIRSGRERTEIAAGLFGAGWIAILAGIFWGIWLPINKNLWTSSYVLFTAGAALEALALCYWLIDVRGLARWARPAIVLGLNPIAIFVLSGLTMKLLMRIQIPTGSGRVSLVSWVHGQLLARWISPVNASVAFALLYLACWLAVAALLYRRRIFIKI